MIERIILARPRTGITDQERDALFEAARVAFASVPGVLSIAFGVGLAVDEPFSWYMRMGFRDDEAMRDFDAHPTHLHFMFNQWRPVMMGYNVRDYQVRLDSRFPLDDETS